MQILLTIIHVAVSLVLIVSVLLQTGKRADLAGAFGGGGSQTAFGARGAATFFSKFTSICAVIFMLTSLGLAILSTQATGRQRSVLDDAQLPAQTEAPAPAAPTSDLPQLPPAPPAGSDAGGAAGDGTSETEPPSSPREGATGEAGDDPDS